MLPSSVRRVVLPGAMTGMASGVSYVSASFRTSASTTFVLVRNQQRRYSSSKPSRSDKDSSGIAAGQSVANNSSTPDTGKSGTQKRKRKSKDASTSGASSFKRLPSVPSTHHMSQEALGLSSFFSLHRPISITQTMPRNVSDEHFASIFAPRSKANKMSDTISTLSNTVDQLEGPMAQLTISSHQDQGIGEGMHKVELRNPDGSESSLHFQVDTMSGDFLPFRPPPLPLTESAADAEGLTSQAEEVDPASLHRVYKAMFTIEESTEADGQIRIVAHSPRIVNHERPRSFLSRMARRQIRANAVRGNDDMYAISVKRQRKLKMKKKKYKKLMKRTRNLRRKLDRT